ncbi:MAG TPA: dihydropteroate synthase [Gemmatimonadaceae bacterium]|nr:dihydropteroate synthase [Gemmatimonadaceae bacterium]
MIQRPPHGGRWRVGDVEIPLDRPVVMGILNVTPDSFSDGGRFDDPLRAIEQAAQMIAEGADIIDVGGESTRPQGAKPVSATEERARVVPVIGEIARRFPRAVISVDTVKSETAAAALGAGARIVNDVSGFRLDPRMAALCARERCGVVLMHSRGEVSDMATYQHAVYEDVTSAVIDELRASLDVALASGIDAGAIALDPGLGFSKRSEHSLAMIAALPRIVSLGQPVLIGASRKRFVGDLTGVRDPSARQYGTVGANVAGLLLGARIFRVHDVAPSRQALDVAWAVIEAAR